MKTEIFNLIILDESGSMHGVKPQTMSGCNETLNTIRNAQQQFTDTQTHFVSIYAFQSGGSKPSRYLVKNEPIGLVQPLANDQYAPFGGTPLYDAVGGTLSDLKAALKDRELAIGSVTIITDGYENSSTHYDHHKVARMIDELKELGWSFNFIGANIDVETEAARMHIDNHLCFREDAEGTSEMFMEERRCRMEYYGRADRTMRATGERERGKARGRLREAAANFFNKKPDTPVIKKCCGETPYKITTLAPNEVCVFGSNPAGRHGGGLAAYAWKHFGAQMGIGEGIQGQSYAIPTTFAHVSQIVPYVERFLEYARNHPQQRFLITRIGCGIAGYIPSEIAPLFVKAVEMPNVTLPKDFLQVIEMTYILES